MDPQEELERAKARVNDRFMWHLYVWRWIRNRCMQCGSRMLIRSDEYGKIKNCSVYPGHKHYATGLNSTFAYWVIIFILLAIIISGSCQKPQVRRGIEPQIRPGDALSVPHMRER